MTEGVPWKLFVAAGSEGGMCVAVESDPQLVGSVAERSLGAGQQIPVGSAPALHGKRAACVPTPVTGDRVPPDADLFAEPLYVLAVDTRQQAGPGLHILAAVVVESASRVVALFSDGTQEEVKPDKGTILLIWRGDRRLDHFELDAPGYASRLRCGGADDAPMPLALSGMSCYTKQ